MSSASPSTSAACTRGRGPDARRSSAPATGPRPLRPPFVVEQRDLSRLPTGHRRCLASVSLSPRQSPTTLDSGAPPCPAPAVWCSLTRDSKLPGPWSPSRGPGVVGLPRSSSVWGGSLTGQSPARRPYRGRADRGPSVGARTTVSARDHSSTSDQWWLRAPGLGTRSSSFASWARATTSPQGVLGWRGWRGPDPDVPDAAPLRGARSGLRADRGGVRCAGAQVSGD